MSAYLGVCDMFTKFYLWYVPIKSASVFLYKQDLWYWHNNFNNCLSGKMFYYVYYKWVNDFFYFLNIIGNHLVKKQPVLFSFKMYNFLFKKKIKLKEICWIFILTIKWCLEQQCKDEIKNIHYCPRSVFD